jgi:hypothetical protein
LLRKLAVLNYAPNGMWTYLVSVYFLQYVEGDGSLEEHQFAGFLDKITAFIWAYAVMRPGVNALRSPAYPEMIEIVNGRPIDFAEYRFEETAVRNALENYVFTNGRPITKSMLAWWAYTDCNQAVISFDTVLEIEHIYSRKRQENEKGLRDKNNLESLGNKSLLEKTINIRVSDYRFGDKKKYYKGFTNDKGKFKEGTKIYELSSMSDKYDDFLEQNVVERKQNMIDGFIKCLRSNDLLV